MIKNLIFSQVRNKHSRLQVAKGQAKNLSLKTPPEKMKDSLQTRLKRYLKFIVPFYGGYLVLRYYNDVVMGEPDGNFPANKKSFIRLQELEKLMKLGTFDGVCSVVAKELLRGNHVTLVRCEGIYISGNFYRNKLIMLEKMNKRTATNPKDGPFHHRAPCMVVKRMIRGMLPNRTGRGQKAFARLSVYDGCPPPC